MRIEFFDCYEHLFEEAYVLLRRVMLAKIHAIKHCRKQNKLLKQIGNSKIKKVHSKKTIYLVKELALAELEVKSVFNEDEIVKDSSNCMSGSSVSLSDSEHSSSSSFSRNPSRNKAKIIIGNSEKPMELQKDKSLSVITE